MNPRLFNAGAVWPGLFNWKVAMKHFIPTVAALLLLCTANGRVLHVDNSDSVPYTVENDKVKQQVVRALVKHRLITGQQKTSCLINIMEIDRCYIVEVWPDGVVSGSRFGVKLKKPFLIPVERYGDCQKDEVPDTNDSCIPDSVGH